MEKRFIIVGAGSLAPGDLPVALEEGDFLAAADAGFQALLKAGQKPDLLIGDFDSMKKPDPETFSGEIIQLPVEKDDTDSLYCVKEGFRRGYTVFVLYGMLGGERISHTIANLQLLSYVKQHGGNAVLKAGKTELFAVSEGETASFHNDAAGNVSVFSLTETACISLKNLYYPGERLTISRSFPLGVSNHFTGKAAEIAVHSGEVLIAAEFRTDRF